MLNICLLYSTTYESVTLSSLRQQISLHIQTSIRTL
ncbi:unnamed protein product [Prunus armeniaca]